MIAVILTAGLLPTMLPALGWHAAGLLLAFLLLCQGTGRLICRAIRATDEPFIAIVTGYVAIAHALVLADMVRAGAQPWVVAAVLPLAAAGLLLQPRGASRAGLGLALAVAGFTAAWCIDIAPRMAAFRETGRLDFWLDMFVHAGSIAQFASPAAIGRGMVLMADWPSPIYHTASLMPVAVLTRLLDLPVLEATVLVWLPLGVLVMAAGFASLGFALAGRGGVLLALAALSLLPAPERTTLGNGFLGFSWLLETAPGTAYSLGVGCAAFAALWRGMTGGGRGDLLLAAALTAGCFMVRANTFVWLAPAIVLTAVVGWPWVRPRQRVALVSAGVLAATVLLAAVSWTYLTTNPRDFLFGYIEMVHLTQGPTRIDGLYAAMQGQVGRIGAGLIGLVLLFLGLLGPWLPLLLLLTILAWRRGVLCPADAAPWLLLLVGTVASLMAPVARNGDISEFRHRAGPLLVAVMAIWAIGLAHRLWAKTIPPSRGGAMVWIGMAGAIAVLALTITSAKRPTMAWGLAHYYGTSVPRELIAVAAAIDPGAAPRPRVAVANLPPEARNIDYAAYVVALTGVPAYLSCLGFLRATGGTIGVEAERRQRVLTQLAAAADLTAMQAIMRAEGITHYVLTRETDASFDPDRRHAAFRAGRFALYLTSAARRSEPLPPHAAGLGAHSEVVTWSDCGAT